MTNENNDEVITIRVIKADDLLPLVYCRINGRTFTRTLKDYAVSDLASLTVIDLINIKKRLDTAYIGRGYAFSWDLLPRQAVTAKCYRNILIGSMDL